MRTGLDCILFPRPIELPAAARLFLLAWISLCLARFFALMTTSPPEATRWPLTPSERRGAPILDRKRPPLEFVLDFDAVEAPLAARCCPTFAITREREMRGLRAMSVFGFGGTVLPVEVVEIVRFLLYSVDAAAASDAFSFFGFGLPW